MMTPLSNRGAVDAKRVVGIFWLDATLACWSFLFQLLGEGHFCWIARMAFSRQELFYSISDEYSTLIWKGQLLCWECLVLLYLSSAYLLSSSSSVPEHCMSTSTLRSESPRLSATKLRHRVVEGHKFQRSMQ
jgi:hypothetical protein